MKKSFFTILYMFSALILCAETHQEQYIKRYSVIAVSEMYRSGVPASITLAQGLLESGYGRSELALKSNNHFGIKCHNGWKGGRVYHDDDAKGECFRKYDRPEDSFKDHSDFLRYRDRYKFLFDYKVTDYKSWANGLKKAGYATDPAYPRKLIKLIEDYRLYEYDKKPASYGKTPKERKENKAHKEHKSQEPEVKIPESPTQVEQVQKISVGKKEEYSFALSRELYSMNGVPFVYSVEGETYRSIAQTHGLFYKELLRFNDLNDEAPLRPGTVVYLQKKKKHGVKGLEMHVVETGDSLWGIAQRYAVRLDALCRINGIDRNGVIREGDIIRLRK